MYKTHVLSLLKKRLMETFLLGIQNMFLTRKNTDDNHFWDDIFFMSTSLFEKLIIQNKIKYHINRAWK